jgi:acylpyruvate hydrolase
VHLKANASREDRLRFATYRLASRRGLAAADETGSYRGLLADHMSYPGTLGSLIAKGEAALRAAAEILIRAGEAVDLGAVKLEQPLAARGKIICVGLNYADHAAESSMKLPDYPTLFARFPSSLIAHDEPIVRPRVSSKLDYEGELVAVIGKAGRRIPRAAALSHVSGYSIFNDGSIRDFQLRTPQWTVGKNFDNTGPFGPVFVSADELPAGAHGLKIQTRLNGRVMQSATTADLICDVATLVALISEAMTLEPGDLIITGTPAGVGAARKPPVFMKAGDVCEVEIEGIGILRNPVVDEAAAAADAA